MDSGNCEISMNLTAASELNLSFNLSKRKGHKGEVFKF